MAQRRLPPHWMTGVELVSLAAMLAMGMAPGSSPTLASLQGLARDDAEADRDRARGYYEGLLDASGGREAAPARRATRRVDAPAGWVWFEDADLIRPDPGFLLWRLRPGLDMRWNGSTFRTNALGYRGPEVASEKPEGTYRVIVLGSSNTLAQGVDDEVGYVRLLERRLASQAGPGLRVEVVNLAVSGYAPTQRLHLLRTEVEALAPDWVVCDVSGLDLFLEEIHLRAVVRQGTPIPYDFVREALARAGVSPDDSPDAFGRKLDAAYRHLLDATFAACAEEARRLRVPFTLVILPRADAETNNRRVRQFYLDCARRHGVSCFDLAGVFDGLELDDYRIAPWEGHPNAFGHRRIFEALREAIDRAGGAPGLAGRVAGRAS